VDVNAYSAGEDAWVSRRESGVFTAGFAKRCLQRRETGITWWQFLDEVQEEMNTSMNRIRAGAAKGSELLKKGQKMHVFSPLAKRNE
jgi:TnpA family transposase